jgi:hypothetical protein
MTDPIIKGDQIYLSRNMIETFDINLLKALAEQYQIVTTQEGMQALKDKDVEATFMEQLDAIKQQMSKALAPKKRKTKSSKNKHKSHMTPPKKRRRRYGQ